MITLTRRYRFSASHRLHSPELSPARNVQLYGKCNNPHGHGHDYMLEVSIAGEVNPVTGLVVPLKAVDRLVEQHVLQTFASRNINLDVPQFQNLTATTENLALVISRLLRCHWRDYLGDTSARLARIYIQETERNGFEVLLGAAEAFLPQLLETETVVNA